MFRGEMQCEHDYFGTAGNSRRDRMAKIFPDVGPINSPRPNLCTRLEFNILLEVSPSTPKEPYRCPHPPLPRTERKTNVAMHPCPAQNAEGELEPSVPRAVRSQSYPGERSFADARECFPALVARRKVVLQYALKDLSQRERETGEYIAYP